MRYSILFSYCDFLETFKNYIKQADIAYNQMQEILKLKLLSISLFKIM